MANIIANNMSRDDLEKTVSKVLSSHSLADVSRRTAMSYANLWKLRKYSENREKAFDRTLISIINAFPEDIK